MVVSTAAEHSQAPQSNDDSSLTGAAAAVSTEEDASVKGMAGAGGKLTLSTLLQQGLIEAGDGVLTIEYLGQTFKGDLLSIGKIRSQETGALFNNPSAWAIYCKKIVNPAKKSGCGWASVKYKGRKMDHFKTVWQKLRNNEASSVQTGDAAAASDNNNASSDEQKPPLPALAAKEEEEDISSALIFSYKQLEIQACSSALPPSPMTPGGPSPVVPPLPQSPVACIPGQQPPPPMVMVGGVPQLLPLAPAPWPNPGGTLVRTETFSQQGKMQPFTVTLSSSALFLLDFHSHMSPLTSVAGYLAGYWDINSQNLAITSAHPCIQDFDGRTNAQEEFDIYTDLYKKNLTLIGWYKSEPDRARVLPSITDCETQLERQMKLLGNCDSTYIPCVGMVNKSNLMSGGKDLDSEHLLFWVTPPNEGLPQFDLGQPMEMVYTMANDKFLSEHVLEQMERLIKHYPNLKSAPNFAASHSSESPLNKLGKSLIPKFPKDQGRNFWQFIKTQLIHRQNGSGMAIPPDDQVISKLLTKHESSSRLTSSSSTITPTMILMSPGGASNGAATIISNRHNSISTGDDDEEEIDDDEDNALLSRSRRDSNRSGIMPASAASTEEVISLLLQRQAPVAPRAHEASSIASIVRGEGGPLDYSAAINSLRPK